MGLAGMLAAAAGAALAAEGDNLPAWPATAKSSVPPTTGKTFQTDPGVAGNGSLTLMGPYKRQVEQAGLIGKATAGKLSEEKVYDSKKVYEGYHFRYSIYVPAAYQKGKPAAFMVLLDGGMYWHPQASEFHAPTVIDNLIASGEMPVTIVLFVAPGGPDPTGKKVDDKYRSDEYDTVSDRFGKFLLEEIVPDVIQKDYDVVDDPNGWGIGGHSSGGSAAFTVGWFFPDRFRKIHTNNGSFTKLAIDKGGKAIAADSYPDMIQKEAAKPLRVTLESGTRDIKNSPHGDWPTANIKMAEALAAKGVPFRFCWGEGYHYRNGAPAGENMGPDQAAADFPNAMRWLWRGYKLPYYADAVVQPATQPDAAK